MARSPRALPARPSRKSFRFELQSAMEYLMTYGWAILIVAVVIGGLFATGIFSDLAGPFVCLGNPPFSCGALSMSSNGGLSINFGYMGSYPVVITGLACNVTTPDKQPSIESQNIVIQPGETRTLVFQCPISNIQLGKDVPIKLWIYYDAEGMNGLVEEYAAGNVKVNYPSLIWNATEWSPISNGIDLLPYGWIAANPEAPANTTVVSTGRWAALKTTTGEGWSYSTDYHNYDTYFGIQTTPFPISPLNLDNAPCSAPYNSHGLTAISYTDMGGTYNFTIISDDGTEVFYRNTSGGQWNSVFGGTAWVLEKPTQYSRVVNIPKGRYELAVDYIDTCDPAGLSFFMISPSPQ